MQPNSQRGYAPTIRGIARSNAQVIVRQNGYIAYQTAVSPGEFEINDMFPTGSNGDYDVTVKEADGSEQHFIVPYSSLPILQRTGRAKYSVTVGKYRDYNNHTLDDFGQATLLYGLPWDITLYGGSQIAGDKYQSVAFGVGQNMQMLGAISWTASGRTPNLTMAAKKSGNPGASATARASSVRAPRFRWPAIVTPAKTTIR